MYMRCKNCGQELANDMRFCTNCGCPVDNPQSASIAFDEDDIILVTTPSVQFASYRRCHTSYNIWYSMLGRKND